MGLFSWISSEVERGKQQVRDDVQAREFRQQSLEETGKWRDQEYDKRMREATRKEACGDHKGAEIARKHANNAMGW